jgi:class 3 adenylate cyclase/tetratricopeptide (TPR) repeat protein
VCGENNPGGSRFCNSCGSALRFPCPECGTSRLSSDAPCPSCGLDGLWERKLVTLLFADLVGATGMAEQLDVERLQELMGAYFEAMRSEVEGVGGIIDQFVGDGVMAVFGVPAAHEDDADRALDAALRMQARLSEMNQILAGSPGVELVMRIGINTGEVLAPAGSPPELGTITGDAANVAARLQELAAPGSVLVSERTVSASSSFTFSDVGTVQLRGRQEPTRVFGLEGRAAARRRRESPLHAALVGRAHELNLLRSLYDRVVNEASPHLVTVYGSAGVGKSRLTAEFIDALATDPTPPTILTGRCLPYGEEVAFGALADLLKGMAGVLDTDPAAFALEKVHKFCADLENGDGALDRKGLASALSYSAGISIGDGRLAQSSPRQVTSEIRIAWRWLFTTMASRRPIVTVIEDIHWADPALLDLLEDLQDRVHGSALFVCPARPGLTDMRPGWGGGRRSFSSITLDPLARDETRQMVELLLATEAIPAAAHGRIFEAAGGNPFFVEEIVYRLIDEGRIGRFPEGWRLSEELDEVQIPDTVQAVLAARIDLLDSPHKRALQCAAVVGRSFWIGVVADMLGLESAEVAYLLDELERRELIRSESQTSMDGEPEFRFKHGLTREVAYAGLPRRERTVLHLAAADWIETVAGDRKPQVQGLLGHHLLQAYDGMRTQLHGSPEAIERLRGRALDTLLQASQWARGRVALGEAKHFAAAARRIAVGPAEESMAVEALGEAFFYEYEGDLAWRYLREAIDLRTTGDGGGLSEIGRLCARALELPLRWPGAMQSPPSEEEVARYLQLGFDHADAQSETAAKLHTSKAFWQHAYPRKGGDDTPPVVSPEDSLAAARAAAEISAGLGKADIESAALDSLAGVYIPIGDYGKAAPPTARRLELLDDLTDLWEIGDTHSMNAWVLYHVGRYDEAFKYADAGFEGTVHEAPSLAIHCLRWRAMCRFRLGDWSGVIDDLVLVRGILGDGRDTPAHYVSPMYAVAAVVHESCGRQKEADEILTTLAAIHEREPEEDRDAYPLARWAEYLAPLLARRGQIDDALRLLRETEWRRGSRNDELIEASCVVAVEAADWTAAAEHANAARRHAAQCGLEALRIAATATEGAVALASGDADGAIGMLTKAKTGYEALHATWDGVRVAQTLQQAYLAVGAKADAVALAHSTLPIAQRMGARREIDAMLELMAEVGSPETSL